MRLSRLSTVMWAAVLFMLAVLSLRRVGRVVEVGLQIASIAYGAHAWSVSSWRTHPPRNSERRDSRHDLWIRDRGLSMAVHGTCRGRGG